MNYSSKAPFSQTHLFEDFDNLEIPAEETSKTVTKFTTSTNKLIIDKGSVKSKDVEFFTTTKACKTMSHSELPYIKGLMGKMSAKEKRARLLRHKSQPMEVSYHKRNTMFNLGAQPSLAKVDSPQILKSIQEHSIVKSSKFVSKEPSSGLVNARLGPIIDEHELGSISENSNSVSE